jgi:integrase
MVRFVSPADPGVRPGNSPLDRINPEENFMLTAKAVERTKAPGRYRCGLVRGLYLQISDNGAKSYVLRFERQGRERMMGLGSASEFSLGEARERARAARQLLADGVDPLAAKQADRQAAKLAGNLKLNFRQAAERYFTQHESKWRSASYRDEFLRSLTAYAYPTLGNMDVATIDTAAILRAIEPHWMTKTTTADRVRVRIEQVLDWCVVRGHRPDGANPAKWKGHLDQVLPSPRKVTPAKHHAALDYHQLPAFVVELRKRTGTSARALEFLILTAARSGEVLGATWDEVDLGSAMWTIPAERMKAGNDHRVPLSPAAIDLLRKLPCEAGNPFVFIGPRGGGLSNMALHELRQRMGFGHITTHGFRASFSSWAYEQSTAAPHAIEISLAHTVGTETERAYRRKDLFAKRARLMEAWSRFCMSPPAKAGGDVVPLRSA